MAQVTIFLVCVLTSGALDMETTDVALDAARGPGDVNPPGGARFTPVCGISAERPPGAVVDDGPDALAWVEVLLAAAAGDVRTAKVALARVATGRMAAEARGAAANPASATLLSISASFQTG